MRLTPHLPERRDEPSVDVPVRRPGGRTREHTEQIHAATMRVLVDEGLGAVTFQRIADEAGVSRATMYRRWATVAELAVDVIRAAASDQIRIVDTGSFEGDLRRVLRQIATFVNGPIGRAAIAASLQLDPAPEAAPVKSWAVRWGEVAPIYERAVARGEIGADVDAEASFAALAGALYFRLIVIGRSISDEWIRRVVRLPLVTTKVP